MAAHVPSWSGFDENLEVHLPGREHTTFLVRVAGRELAAINGVAVVLHGVRTLNLTAEEMGFAARTSQVFV